MVFDTYKPAAFASLLSLINAADSVDGAGLGLSAEELSNRLSPPRFSDSNVCLAWHEERLVGYILLDAREQGAEQHFIATGIVKPSFRAQGIGWRLLEWAEKRSRALARRGQASLLVPVRHSIGGLQALVEDYGMKPRYFFHVLHFLAGDNLPGEVLPPPDIVLREFTGEADVRAYTSLLNEIFARDASEEEIRDVTEESIFQSSLWLFAYQGDDMVGFCTCSQSGQEGEVEFLGVQKSHRGRGLGSVLLRAGLQALTRAGCSEIRLAVNVENEQALQLYKQAGFSEWRKSTTYELRL